MGSRHVEKRDKAEKKHEKVLLMTPERRHLVVELEEPYNRKDLEVLLKAFRKRLMDSGGIGMDEVDRVVGPGFVIEMLGSRQQAVTIKASANKRERNRS